MGVTASLGVPVFSTYRSVLLLSSGLKRLPTGLQGGVIIQASTVRSVVAVEREILQTSRLVRGSGYAKGFAV